MKTKQVVLFALCATWCLFGASQVFGADGTTLFQTRVRIESITKVVPNGAAVSLPLTSSSTIYFDVKLKDIGGTPNLEFLGNSLQSGVTDRPYLVLNIPLEGTSVKNRAGRPAEMTLNSGEENENSTSEAVAYYKGQGDSADVLRFVYNVRPGDMVEAITWATEESGSTVGAPRFGGAVTGIYVNTYQGATNYNGTLTKASLVGEATPAVPDTTLTADPWAVCGYSFLIGNPDNELDNDRDYLYQGLAPVTVYTANDAAVTTMATAYARNFYFWVDVWNETENKWKFCPAGVTYMQSDDTEISEGVFNGTPSETFTSAWTAKVTGPTNTSATSFAKQLYYVNIPASIPAGSKVRLCYGVQRTATAGGKLYSAYETTVEEAPFATDATVKQSGYNVLCADMTSGTFTLPGSGLTHTELQNREVTGGTINAGAGETITLTVAKNSMTRLKNYGTLYADVECISEENSAQAYFNRYTVPLDPNTKAGGVTLTMTIAEGATANESYFRIRVPQLNEEGTEDLDKPFYIKVVSSPKRETITLTPESGEQGTEYYAVTTEASSFIHYTLTVASSTSNRYFLIYPVGRDGTTRITSDAIFADGRKVHETLSRYVRLQTQSGQILPSSGVEMVVSVPAGATSADFYVACANDVAGIYLTGDVTVDGATVPMGGALFVAKSCNSAGIITGTNDVCNGIAQPLVSNRNPTITSSTAPTSGASGTAITFSFGVQDVYSDYLVTQMTYGDGTSEAYLYADEAEMIAIMGETAWQAELVEIAERFGGTADDYKWNDDATLRGQYRRARKSTGQESVTFKHTYDTSSAVTWRFEVVDSSGGIADATGTITLQTSQRFTFYTVLSSTLPGTGYVRWGTETAKPGDVGFNWAFGETFTYNALSKDGNTSVLVQAMPFAAGTASPAGFTAISTTRDSFFYKWTTRNSSYDSLLPTGDKIYESGQSINRAFVSGGGTSEGSKDWEDIVLQAIFVAEYLPGDSLDVASDASYLRNLGDYNSDGVPDGWVLRNLGTDARTIVEGSSVANTSVEGDTLPLAGWGAGDAAYKLGSSDGRLGTVNSLGPCTTGGSATPFGYKLRVRGRDDALNAADGAGNWLSNPAWVVLVHPETDDAGVVRAGTLANNVFTPAWNQVRLATSRYTEVAGVTVAWTADNKIPYDSAHVQPDGWAYVIDANGRPITTAIAGSGYTANNVMVQTDATSEDYECFKYSYTRYTIDGDDTTYPDGAIFPFITAAGSTDAQTGNVDTWGGATYQNTFYYIDARVPAGILIDEPFYTDAAHQTDGKLDPRKTNWLDRFNNVSSGDQDSDGIVNGVEYYFWYYASRIAWASVYTDENNEHVQINTALWPAVDLRNRTKSNTDADFGTSEQFTLGRRFRNAYDPDASSNAFAVIDPVTGRVTTRPGNATLGKGNYWEPIPAADVLAAFDPYTANGSKDTDNDGLSDIEEIAYGTNPIDCDTDNDWIIDGWEATYGLDPLNVSNNNANDAELNPDNDYFASALVRTYPDFHHLFKVGAVDTTGASPFADLTESAYYFDYESRVFRTIANEVAEDTANLILGNTVSATDATISWDDGKGYVTSWSDEAPLFLEMLPEYKIIRDFEVYTTFGFDPLTGWGLSTTLHSTRAPKKFNGLVWGANTQPFVSREEFNSAIKRGAGNWKSMSTDPNNADTNGDGVPDGWEAYVGMRPYVFDGTPDGAIDYDNDGLTTAQEFQCLGANICAEFWNWASTLSSDTHNTLWTNKILPTDPLNPDTDFDGVYDGDEGNATYCYNPSIADWEGGGCCPTRADTDGDGMTDGWEYRYGVIASTSEDSSDSDDSTTTSTTTTTSSRIPKGPDPTDASDYSVDYDRDGLPQYQEYLTGFLRHVRYDLGPDAARILKDVPGVLDGTEGVPLRWKTLPDAYNAMTDLANPEPLRSLEYDAVSRTGTGAFYETITADPLTQAFASTPWAQQTEANRYALTTRAALIPEQCAPAITLAFNRLWSSSAVFPTEDQLDTYKLNPVPDALTSEAETKAYTLVVRLQRHLSLLDVAYQRFLAAVDGNPLLQLRGTNDRAVSERQVRALVALVDVDLEALQETEVSDALQPVVKDLIEGETQTLWEARKNQILRQLVSLGYAGIATAAADSAYEGMTTLATEAGTAGATYTTEDTTDYTTALESALSAYEEAVVGATNPLIRQSYRAAVRGYTGGVSPEGLLMPVGMHMPLRLFEERMNGDTALLGVPLQRSTLLGATLPQCSLTEDPFITTSPLVPDTDADGMDDYWEVFHGLNPVLGDFLNTSYNNPDSSDRGNYAIDKIQTVYLRDSSIRQSSALAVYTALTPSLSNPFANPAIENINTLTGYDYFTYPWIAGLPQADPDGDGLLNFEEAVNPQSDVAHYGTDPSPLWMTDPDNRNSFVTRFYSRTNPNVFNDVVIDGDGEDAGAVDETTITANLLAVVDAVPYTAFSGDSTPGATASMFPYEINEGFDTDGDGVSDATELTTSSIYKGDPQTLRTPDRSQVAYFGGSGAMQSHVTTLFAPTALQTFTLECWVNPDEEQVDWREYSYTPDSSSTAVTVQEVVLLDRPWRFNEAAATPGDLRHNFRLTLQKPATGSGYLPSANFTGAGTTFETSATVPQVSPTVVASEPIKAGEWTHLAVTYDGEKLALYVNGVENSSKACKLIPATGVISLHNTPLDDIERFTFRSAPIILGAGPNDAGWFAELGDPDDESTIEDTYTGRYKGFLDEVRIWNGARTSTQIADNRSRTFTLAELLAFRVSVFNARRSGQGYFQPNTPAEPLAIYTFNDLLAGSRTSDPSGTTTIDDSPWERYPGQKVIGGDDTPGSFTYRRTGLIATRDGTAGHPRITADALPTVQELFTSYYTLTAGKNLRSTMYCENPGEDVPFTEFVPIAHNTIDHLPVADVERTNAYLFRPEATVNGSPKLTLPSGAVENLKPEDSIFWTPYAGGWAVSTSKVYDVKTSGNPYAYRYLGTTTFESARYTTLAAYTTRYSADLLLYGDVFSKYVLESWDNSPSTDPSAAKPESDASEGDTWFDYDSGDSKMTDQQYSKGGAWLDKNIAIGQTKDSDGDRMPNWWENYYGLDPEDATGVNGPHGDQDGDYLTNYAEYLARSNPGKYSTAGNGVPDFHIPIWFRRGRPTFGLLYTDNDFMEDHAEASNRSERLSVDKHDAEVDADNDGWSNWAEMRAGFRSSSHSTNPNAEYTFSQTGEKVLEMPTPALRLTVDYFGDQNVYTNATESAQLVVHAYTAKNNNSEPDATFILPLSTDASSSTEQDTVTTPLGFWKRGSFSGYLHFGNVIPGSLAMTYRRYTSNVTSTTEGTTSTEQTAAEFTIVGDPNADGDVAELYTDMARSTLDNEGNLITYNVRVPAGTINYRTGFYTLDFSDETAWPVEGYISTTEEDGSTTYTTYKRTEFTGTASYKYGIVAGKSNTFTLVKPTSGHLREGANNFFVFADLNGDGNWNRGEPAGIPDAHDVDVGFDLVNQPLHVALTELAPPGAVRVDLQEIRGILTTEAITNDEVTGDTSSIINPTTGQPLQPSLFNSDMAYRIALVPYENISIGQITTDKPSIDYIKPYNVKKSYISEDEIFGSNPEGLPGTEAVNQVAKSYKVYLLPETVDNDTTLWTQYNIAQVTNVFSKLDDASTSIVSPTGGAMVYNTELTFEWLSNIQVPTFSLAITKVGDALGNAINELVYQDTQIRGVAPCGTAPGNGSVEQYRYRYQLPRGIGELNNGGTLFGDGLYTYTLTLKPYCGTAKTLEGSFRIQLNASGDTALAENAGTNRTTSYNAQEAFYLRARIRYNGVLCEDADFGGRKIRIEAHRSGSFNGDPVAATSDFLVHDAVDSAGSYTDAGETDAINRCVRMVKDKASTRTRTVSSGSGETATTATETYNAFWSTRFDAEIRGFSTNDPVFLMAYLDLNGNGKRDAWEPWGYATQGQNAIGGFYFDPKPLTPVNTGKDYAVEFYIQDVDTDNDKLADSWEWLNAGQPTTDFSAWCETFKGTTGNHTQQDIWVVGADGTVSLTAYGAQLYGVRISGVDASGAAILDGVPEGTDLSAVQEIAETLGTESAVRLLNEGYYLFGLTVNNIANNGDGSVTLSWDVTSATSSDSEVTLTSAFASNAVTSASYAIYGKASLSDATWTKLSEVQVRGTPQPSVTLSSEEATLTGEDGTASKATFFKVILSAKTASETVE